VATGVTLLVRWVEPGGRTLGYAVGELGLYIAVACLVTWYTESALLREAVGYLVRPRAASAAP
jgi:proteasome assembly chaperone (PAC2) family protein